MLKSNKTQKYYAIDSDGLLITSIKADSEYAAMLKFDAILTPNERNRWVLNDKAIISEKELENF